MQPDRITFTGFDDQTDIGRLIEISARHPTVEWGVLVPMKGRGRWPSRVAVEKLIARAAMAPHLVQLAGHLCEPIVADVLAGRSRVVDAVGYAFDRIQLNTHGATMERAEDWLHPMYEDDREFILQLDGVTSPLLVEDIGRLEQGRRERSPFSGLFDLSHGAGVLPEGWPALSTMARPLRWYGYAGGLGPHNMAEQLPKIEDAAEGFAYWIDMETHVRTDGRFDLDKVERVLEIVFDPVAA